MKKILFKGFTLDGTEGTEKILLNNKPYKGFWVEGDYFTHLGTPFILTHGSEDVSYTVLPETIAAYTGCKDKTGNKIFENDVVISRYDEDSPADFCLEQIVWEDHATTGTIGYYVRQLFPECEQEPEDLELIEDFIGEKSTVIGSIYNTSVIAEIINAQEENIAI